MKFDEVDETVVFQLKFPGGAVASCNTSYNAPPDAHFRVYAENGWFGLDPAFNYNGNRGTRSDGPGNFLSADG